MRVEKDFEEFINLLNENDVKYLVIGAFAVSFHARPRFTGDIDFFVDSSSQNIENLLQTLEQFGFGSLDLSEKDFNRGSILQLGYEPNRIDVLTDISGVQFKTAWKNRVKGNYGNQTSYFISFDDLIANKKASNRLKDRSDLELLEKFKK
jgi:hypothetical protein